FGGRRVTRGIGPMEQRAMDRLADRRPWASVAKPFRRDPTLGGGEPFPVVVVGDLLARGAFHERFGGGGRGRRVCPRPACHAPPQTVSLPGFPRVGRHPGSPVLEGDGWREILPSAPPTGFRRVVPEREHGGAPGGFHRGRRLG